ncbi:C40 family peptidase [Amycolatopsis thailandensis]|uniref:C40 family peptidase n=1 Tax=Amycolatopsis thailandensis TaxID=589330 RepID=UPI0036454B07
MDTSRSGLVAVTATAIVMQMLAPIAALGIVLIAAGGGPGPICEPPETGIGRIVKDPTPAPSAEQLDIARTIVTIVRQRGLPRRAAVLTISTGLVESKLANLTYGDRDSLGVFQQRPSQGWGTPAQILNPVYATNAFLDRLVAIPGWDTLPPGQAQQRVQRSGFPDRYAPRESEAARITNAVWTATAPPAAPARQPTEIADLPAGCADDGGSDIPISPNEVDRTKLPADFQYPADPRQRAAVTYALAQLGKPYVWGGKGPDGFDCSGLMLAAWAAAGVAIPAGTVSQVHAGHAVPGLNQVQPGDLLFIPGSLGTPANPRHVGMYAGHGLIVNSYDSSTGVILEPLSAWSGKIVMIRRVSDTGTPSPNSGGRPPDGQQPGPRQRHGPRRSPHGPDHRRTHNDPRARSRDQHRRGRDMRGYR